ERRGDLVLPVQRRVDVAAAVPVQAIPVGDDRRDQRRGQAGPADAEPAGDGLAAAERGADAIRGGVVARAELGVRGVLVGVGRDVRDLAARRAVLGQRALSRAVAEGGTGVDDARALLVRRHAPELAATAASGPVRGAPEEAALVVVGRAGPGAVAQVLRVPHGLAGPRVTRVRVR